MSRLSALLGALLLTCSSALAEPLPRVDPAAAGFDPERLEQAVEFARSIAVTEPSDLAEVLRASWSSREPDYRILGRTQSRAGDAGMILRGGQVVAEWGDLERTDMVFSVAKSYLATVAGVAVRDGAIEDLDRRVAEDLPGEQFRGTHNGAITWRHLLHQNSDWSGTLWDVPDWADRPEGDQAHWAHRPLHEPGTRYKYNDVRINLLALSLLRILGEPLPDVLRREIMDPIGASDSWRWEGYENSWVEIDGERVQSVSGGGHFGGGMFISTEDQARFGLLMLNRGVWNGQRLLPDAWFDEIRQAAPTNAEYGLLWWLNPGRARIPSAPETVYWAAGFGGNYVYIDEEHDLVVVLRWIPDLPAVIERVMAALN